MSSLKKYFFGKKSIAGANTFIGGVAGAINTASLLAAKLGISSSRISLFQVRGNDIECKITDNYNVPDSCFIGNQSITYYNDADGLVLIIADMAFREATNLAWVSFPKCTHVCTTNGYLAFYLCTSLESVNFPEALYVWTQAFQGCEKMINYSFPKVHTLGSYCFAQNLAAKSIYIPKCTNLGGGVGNNMAFQSIPPGFVVTVPESLRTNNAGNPDGDIVYAQSNGGTVIYV